MKSPKKRSVSVDTMDDLPNLDDPHFPDLNAEAYLDVAFGPGTPGMGGANGSHHQRTKRMRTSFKHHQLRTMKSYFAINHNPDAKDLKQLSQKTGLPKRVLQFHCKCSRAANVASARESYGRVFRRKAPHSLVYQLLAPDQQNFHLRNPQK
ncbi:LIM/homeobox protein Lhx2 [Homalodisca vitripennis]|nr:LIM/homeobox protein Lhx2 [Homalodisca vitripennis]